jgi:allantoin racemase
MKMAARAMRVLYQSFTDPAVHMPYLSRLSDYLSSVASPGVEFEVRGMHPADTQLGRLSELRCGIQSVAGIIDAENEGFDAVLVGHFQDSLLFEARTAVDIPVIGHGEASLHQACMLGSRIGLVCIDPVYVPWHREQVRRYGLEERVVDVRAMVMSPAEAVAAFDDFLEYERIRSSFLGLASKMIAESGVDVVMSAGGLFALLGARDPALEIEGALIANPTLLAVKQAELAVSVARTTGQAVSRGSAFAKSSKQSIYEFMELAVPNRN